MAHLLTQWALFVIAGAIFYSSHIISAKLSTILPHDNPDYYEPTEDELHQGVAFAAPKYWGVHIRQSKSLRIAFIGGSQTAYGQYMNSFQKAIEPEALRMNWTVATYNEGRVGAAPGPRSYNFLTRNSSE